MRIRLIAIGVLSLVLSNCYREAYRVPRIDPDQSECNKKALIMLEQVPLNRRTNTNETRAILKSWVKCAQFFEIQGRKNHKAALKNRPDGWFEDTIEIFGIPVFVGIIAFAFAG